MSFQKLDPCLGSDAKSWPHLSFLPALCGTCLPPLATSLSSQLLMGSSLYPSPSQHPPHREPRATALGVQRSRVCVSLRSGDRLNTLPQMPLWGQPECPLENWAGRSLDRAGRRVPGRQAWGGGDAGRSAVLWKQASSETLGGNTWPVSAGGPAVLA